MVSGGQEAGQARGSEISDFGNGEQGRGSRDTDEGRGASGRRLPPRFQSWMIRKSEVAVIGEGLVGRRKMECSVCSVKAWTSFLFIIFFKFIYF